MSDVSSSDRAAGQPTATDVAVSVVVPCYNEQDCIDELYHRLKSALDQATGNDHEMVLVNDGSSDRTWDRIRTLSEIDHHVIGVNLSRNHGHQLALTAGLSLVRGKRVLIIDADLQDPPELLSQMMALMDQGADVVYGQRDSRAGESWFKTWTASLFYRLLNGLVDVEIPVDTGDFRLINRRALDVLLSMPEHHRFLRGMISWIGMNQVPLRYRRDARFAGETKYSLVKMLLFAIDAITSFSISPLRLASQIGLTMGLIGVGLMIYTLYSWLFLDTLSGWTSLMSVVVLLGSVQMLVLGVMGEYLGRLYLQAKQRPLFVIKEITTSRALMADPSAKDAGGPAPTPAGVARTTHAATPGSAGPGS